MFLKDPNFLYIKCQILSWSGPDPKSNYIDCSKPVGFKKYKIEPELEPCAGTGKRNEVTQDKHEERFCVYVVGMKFRCCLERLKNSIRILSGPLILHFYTSLWIAIDLIKKLFVSLHT